MSQAVLTLKLPEEIYERVRRAARGMNQPVETALVNIVRAATPSLEKVPIEYRPELEALEDLGDNELWRVAESQPTPAQERRLATLLDRNREGALSPRDQQALTELRTTADRLLLRRSYAYLLLKYRGHRIPSLAELRK